MLTKVVCMGLRNGPGFVASALGAITLPPHRYEGMISREWFEQCRWNLQGIFASPYWCPYYILEVKGQGHSRSSRWQRMLWSSKSIF